MTRSTPPPHLLIHWPRFGPYHRARLQTAVECFVERGITVSGLEIASLDSIYAWREEDNREQPIHTLFPGQNYNTIPLATLARSLYTYLGQVHPTAIAVNGYSSRSALLLMLWCKLHRCSAMLMSESKTDDSPRSFWREFLKGTLVRSYDAYSCGGTPHKAYLQSLGAPADRIFMGYDAVDNAFFQQQALQAQQQPEANRHLPGLSDPHPFFLVSNRFVPRKNLLGLLKAYRLYQKRMSKSGSSPWRLIILGDGPQRNELEDFIREYNLQRWITLPGFRQIEELSAYYGTAQVFIHPALQDQWGLVVNEAMASGLPVLVSERAGCAYDLLEDGIEGYKFDPENAHNLADLLWRFSTDQVDRNAMAEAARLKISKWGLERFASSLFQAFQAMYIEKMN